MISDNTKITIQLTVQLVVLLLVLSGCNHSDIDKTSNQSLFEKYYYQNAIDNLTDFIECKNGGFYAIGSIKSSVVGNTAIILKMNALGDTLWTYKADSTQGLSVIETSDGGSIGVFSNSIVRLNTSGKLLSRNRNIKGLRISKIVNAHGGNFLLCASDYWSDPYGGFNGRSRITNLDENLKELWSLPYSEVFLHVQKLTSEGYSLVVRPKYINYKDPLDFIFEIIDNKGSKIHTYTYGDTDVEQLGSMVETRNGGFLLSGDYLWGYSGHAYIIRTDQFGEVIWEKEYHNGVHDLGQGVIELADGDIVLLKSGAEAIVPNEGYSYRGEKFQVMRLSSSGELKWETEFKGEDNNNWIHGVLIETRKGYAIFGNLKGRFIVTEITR